MIVLALASGGDLGRDGARAAAQHELGRTAYQNAKPSLVMRALQWLFGKVSAALGHATNVVPGGALGLVLTVLLIALVVAAVLYRVRPATRGAFGGELFTGTATMTAAEHRARADAAAAAGAWDQAVRERLRAVARELEARGVVDPRAGRTADELAREAGTAVPAVAEPLRRGTRLFDEVWYGGRTADASSYAVLVEVDRVVQQSRLVRP